jgi:hypothetical protein
LGKAPNVALQLGVQVTDGYTLKQPSYLPIQAIYNNAILLTSPRQTQPSTMLRLYLNVRNRSAETCFVKLSAN